MSTRSPRDLAAEVARIATDHDISVGVAESLTSGALVSELGRAQDASQWLRGGITAYAPAVKHRLLEVTPGPLVSARCAEEMATGAASVLDADIVVSTTGVGGPDAEEGREPGTVYLGWCVRGRIGSELCEFEGSPADVVHATVSAALERLVRELETNLSQFDHDEYR